MAKHRPAHARSGLGRYTPPRRIHPAHAMSARGSGLGRLAGGVLGGSAIATAGFLALAGMPAGASPAVSVEVQTPGPLITFSLSPSFIGHNAATTTLSSGGTPALALAVAGGPGGFESNHNTAVADVSSPSSTGIAPFGVAISFAGVGTNTTDHDDDNTATSVQQGFGFSLSTAGNGNDSDNDFNSASSLSFDGAAISLAGDGTDSDNFGNSASSIAFGGAVLGPNPVLGEPPLVATFVPAFALAIAGEGADADMAFNVARASAQDAGTSIAIAALDEHGSSDNMSIATSSLAPFLFGGGAFAFSGEGDGNTAIAGADGVAGVAPFSLSTAEAGRGDDNFAVAGSVLGVATAEAGQGDDNEAGAQADAGGVATAEAGDGSGNASFAGASGPGGAAIAVTTSAPGGSAVGATSAVGSTSFADSSSGVWAVSLNGGTVIS